MTDESKTLYAAAWRWHFYAGLFTAPFLVLLATTGLAMLFADRLERWQYPKLTRGGPAAVSHQARLDAAAAALPGAKLVRYHPGGASGETTRVEVDLAGTPYTVYVDEATGRALGQIPAGRRIGVLAEKIHGTLLLGDFGDRLIETAAGFGVLLTVTGLYLGWPRRGERRLAAPAPRSPRSRPFWRGLHRRVGSVLAPVLLFYLISGLAWTGLWGERLVQAWSTFPAEKWGPAAGSGHDHASLNGGARKAVPWNLEQAALPAAPLAAPSGARAEPRLSLDEALAVARREGIGRRFWAGSPEGRDDVWTIAQAGLSGEITDPRDELTVHIDRRTGRVLGRAGWNDYGPGARAMAAGLPLHMGHLGGWSTAGAALVCVLVLLLALSGPAMWWLRRPARAFRLAAPSAPARLPKGAWALLLLSLAFPLTALTIAAVVLADALLFRRLPRLRGALD